MSRHESRQKLAREFGATDIVIERSDDAGGAVLYPRPSAWRPAPVPRYLPGLIELTLPLEQVAEGYCTMDERRAMKTLLRPQ